MKITYFFRSAPRCPVIKRARPFRPVDANEIIIADLQVCIAIPIDQIYCAKKSMDENPRRPLWIEWTIFYHSSIRT